MFSLYKNKTDQKPTNISVENYVQMIQSGTWQDVVIAARATIKDKKKYTFIKSQAPTITGSCVMKPGSKVDNNIDYMNGFAVIDIDQELTKSQYYAVKEDKYTSIIHKSISGVNYCVFIKIDKNKDYKQLYESIGEYYYNTFNITIDASCKNRNRLRFISWDEDIYYNEKSNIYRKVKKRKHPKKADTNYIFTQSDFDSILGQIKDRGLDLCRDDYFRYVQIGMSFANEFGLSGKDAFHLVCSLGSKYNYDHAERDYKGFCKRANNQSSIGTFYYLCKEDGIDIYTEKTKAIINRVKVSKSQGKPTLESVKSNLKVANDIDTTPEDEKLIQHLIDSKIDYSKNANSELTEIEQLERFIIDTYTPYFDTISNITYIYNDTRLTDKEINDIYLTCKKNFDFNIPKNDVISIINSSATKRIEPLKSFLIENKSTPTGYIDKYIDCISPQSDYNRWAFKKWLVGALHNWTANYNQTLVCPLTLVLTGQKHGTGKTSFLRNILPLELRKYIAEIKIDGSDKDSMYTLCSSLLVFDDEFGGKGMKDVKAYKSISDTNIITQRRPYAKELETFKRRAILCGTTNEIDILKDVTGNRRILPIEVDSVDYDTVISIDTKQLIIEAYNLLKDGFDWMIRTEEDIEYLAKNTEENNVVLPIEEIFFNYFSFTENDEFNNKAILNQGEILDYLTKKTHLKVTKYDAREIFIKHKKKYKNYRENGKLKKGYVLYTQDDNLNVVPF